MVEKSTRCLIRLSNEWVKNLLPFEKISERWAKKPMSSTINIKFAIFITFSVVFSQLNFSTFKGFTNLNKSI
ncbi:hypothetical protein BpHYR1_010634 [Brachionus plicatilis]|uniref:Uncharacterized protein n=1 Tax=Brachionus plicatilis TaxID=10195 RepID=A0A3M7S757_BRAPC|nr:hypothetical protein BpHYR1_010634 [Brachionus plicatilis]